MDVIYIIVALALVFSAGFFSSAETAVLAANRMRLRHLAATGNRRATRVLSFLDKPDTFLTSILFGLLADGIRLVPRLVDDPCRLSTYVIDVFPGLVRHIAEAESDLSDGLPGRPRPFVRRLNDRCHCPSTLP